MLSKVPARQIYIKDYGWHVGRFHFAFADYQDPGNTCFGDLMTFNDFTLQPGSGFETHPHREIEIVSYCVEGELVHEDNLGNKETIKRGEMQYTCAGSGITHSERNDSPDTTLRFIQIWVRPNAAGLVPYYHSYHFCQSDRLNKLQQITSGQTIENGPRINQDTSIFVSELQQGRQLGFNHLPERQVYLACLEGKLGVNDLLLNAGDALKVWSEVGLTLTALHDAHLIMVEMPGIH